MYSTLSMSSELNHINLPGDASGKESACNAGDLSSIPGFDSWVGKNLWRRKWQPTPILLPGESHGQRSLVGYSPWVCKELGTIEVTLHACMHPN